MIQTFRNGQSFSFPALFAVWSLAVMPAAPAGGVMTIELCNAQGEVRSVDIPFEKDGGDGENCAQPCHACLSRQKPTGKQART
ncbi:MAG: hypothetical protein AAGE37_04730 [Pseudomonadota bacterium]